MIDALFRFWLITYKTSAQPSRMRKRYVQALYLSAGFGDLKRILYMDIKKLKPKKRRNGMKKKTVVGLIAIVAITMVVIFAGCIEEKELIVPTPTPTPAHPEPIYSRGDVLKNPPTDDPSKIATIVLYYSDYADEYKLNYIHKNDDGEWYSIAREYHERWADRDVIEDEEKYCKIGHIDSTEINSWIEDNKNFGVYIKVSYMGEWSGTVGGIGSSKSVEGWGDEDFFISYEDDIVSACFHKEENDNSILSVEITKDGKLIEYESTSAAYGMVCVSASV